MPVTRIRGNTQIMSNTIDLDKLMSPFISSTTGNWDITNGNLDATITGIPDPVNDYDVVNKHYVDQLAIGRIWKSPVVDVFADSNIDITNPPSTIDGVTLNNGDRIALFNQTTSSEDGVYIYNGAGNALTRAPEWEAGMDAAGWTFVVDKGDNYKDSIWTVTNDKGSAVIGTDDLSVLRTGGSGLYTFQNALTKTGDTIEWGGTLLHDTTVDGASSYLVGFNNLTGFSVATNSNQYVLSMDNAEVAFGYENGADYNKFIATTTNITMAYQVSGEISFLFDATGAVFTNTVNDEGLKYAADYHTGYVDRSLVDKQYVDTYDKVKVRARATGNVDISSAPATIDGVSLNNGDLVLLDQQTTTSDDGIYVFNGTGNAMTRAPYFESGIDISGLAIYVAEGTANGNSYFVVSNTGTAILGTDDISVLAVGGGAAAYQFRNGLTESGGIVELGGTLIQNTTIDFATYGMLFHSVDRFILSDGTSADPVNDTNANYIDFDHGTRRIRLNTTNGSMRSILGVTAVNGWGLARIDLSSGNETSIQINPGTFDSILVTDSINDFGMKYAADYSTNGTADDRWIPDFGAVKNYVDNKTNRVYGAAPTITTGTNTVSIDITGYTASDDAVFYNGARLKETDDYTITSNVDTLTIQFTENFQTGDIVLVDYSLTPN